MNGAHIWQMANKFGEIQRTVVCQNSAQLLVKNSAQLFVKIQQFQIWSN